MLPPGHRIGLVRADAGFCVTAFFTALDARELPYIIVARLTPLVRKLVIHRIPEADWRSVARGVAVADRLVSLPAWHGQVRRFVCLRQTLTERPDASGRRLRAIRDLVFLVGADLIPHARRLRVRFAVPPEERAEFLERLRTRSEGLPIAAQLEWELTDPNELNQTPVHVVNVPVPTGRSSPHPSRASP